MVALYLAKLRNMLPSTRMLSLPGASSLKKQRSKIKMAKLVNAQLIAESQLRLEKMVPLLDVEDKTAGFTGAWQRPAS